MDDYDRYRSQRRRSSRDPYDSSGRDAYDRDSYGTSSRYDRSSSRYSSSAGDDSRRSRYDSADDGITYRTRRTSSDDNISYRPRRSTADAYDTSRAGRSTAGSDSSYRTSRSTYGTSYGSSYGTSSTARTGRSTTSADSTYRTGRVSSGSGTTSRTGRVSSGSGTTSRTGRVLVDSDTTSRTRRSSYDDDTSSRSRQSSTQANRQTRQSYQRQSPQAQPEEQSTRQTAVRRSTSQARANSTTQRSTTQRASNQRTTTRDTRAYSSRRSSSGGVTGVSLTGGWSPSPKKGSSKKVIVIGAIVGVLVIALIGVFAFANSITGTMNAGVTQDLRAALVETDMSKEPFYMLLMGTDGSAERDEDEEFGGEYRSDSIMLARIDAPNKKVTLISIHRDTRVDFGEYGVQKINNARVIGGPAMAVETVSKLADVPISHYAEINFDAFRAVVDALGGIEVNVPVDIEDWDAGGVLSAGEQTLNGEQALILCRSRNTYSNFVGDADQMRSANQRLVLSAIAKKLLASDVATIANTVRQIAGYVTTDLELNDIIGLAQALQGLDSETDIYTANQPADAVYEDDIWWCVTDEEEWTKMMDRVKEGLPPTEYTEIDETTGTVLATAGGETAEDTEFYTWVSILNGTTREGLAREAGEVLENAGYVHLWVDAADRDDYQETLILYQEPAQAYGANRIAQTLKQGRVMLNDGSIYQDTSFLVIIGDDWESR